MNWEKNTTKLNIPYDIYESPNEIFIVMPLWGVKKESLRIEIKEYKLHITGTRENITVKDSLNPVKQQCYRGKINEIINLPNHIYFDKIHSKLSPENILQIIIPKAVIPNHIKVNIE